MTAFYLLLASLSKAHIIGLMTSGCLRCGNTPTINAHIIPQAVIRAIRKRGPDTKTLGVRFGGAFPINTPNGLSDRKILCSSCDGAIGIADKWFLEALDDLHSSARDTKPYNVIQPSLDAKLALRFAVSIVYRASLSQSQHFVGISLGSYTDIAANIAIGAEGADFGSVLVLLNVLTSRNLDTKQFAFYPVRCMGDNGAYFVFVISGIQFLVKFGGRLKGITNKDLYSASLRLKADQEVKACCYPFEHTAEADWLGSIARRNSGQANF
jgi:hypothetical protein